MPDDTEISIAEKAHELDALFCNHAQIAQFNQFFCENEKFLIRIFRESICCNNMFSIEFISGIDIPYVKIICVFLEEGETVNRSGKMRYCASIIMSKNISRDKKAMFWDVLVNALCFRDSVFTQDIFMDNEYARKALLDFQKDGEKSDFIRNSSPSKKYFWRRNEIIKGTMEDSVSVFEMNRQMAGRNITITMLQCLLHHNAVKCFIYLLAHFPKKVYKYRSAEEWLFTVCRNYPPKTAIPIIQWLEEDKPGIVANARDPWGNTLLWNTCVNRDCQVNEIQEVLINLGCDPDLENQWGLSFRLVQENKLEIWDR